MAKKIIAKINDNKIIPLTEKEIQENKFKSLSKKTISEYKDTLKKLS